MKRINELYVLKTFTMNIRYSKSLFQKTDPKHACPHDSQLRQEEQQCQRLPTLPSMK